MSVAHGCHNAMTQTRETAFDAGYPASIRNGPRVETGGTRHASVRPPAATSDDQAFNATAVWRACNLEGYLERKLHRQWRSRGS